MMDDGMQEPVFVVFRCPTSRIQSCKNSLMGIMPAHKDYSNDISGFSPKVCILEGNFPQDKGIAFLAFGSLQQAELWKETVPEFTKPDWMDGVDILIIPVCKMPSIGTRFVQLVEYQDRAVDRQLPVSGDYEVVSVDADKMITLQGSWHPSYIVANFFPSKFLLDTHRFSDQRLRCAKRDPEKVNVVTFQLKPIFNENEDGVFLIIRFPCSRYESVKTSLALGILKNENFIGRATGISEKIFIVKGYFPPNKSIAIVSFTSRIAAESYLETLPEAKTSYYIDGVDLLLVPASRIPPDDKRFIQMNDLRFNDLDEYLHENQCAIKQQLQDAGACDGLVFASANEITTLKGPWAPKQLIINCWESRDAFEAYYCSEVNVEKSSRRFDFVDTVYCTFELQPIAKMKERPVILIIQYPMSRLPSWKRYWMKIMPVYKTDSVDVAGISTQLCNLEGNCPINRGLTIFSFSSMREAELWKDSVHDFRQSTWMDGVDMVIIPVLKMPPVKNRFIEMIDLRFENVNQYMSEFSSDVEEQLREADVCCQVLSACSDSIYKVTNGWNPKHLVLKFWRSETEFKSAYNSDNFVKLRRRWFIEVTSTWSFLLENLQELVFLVMRFPCTFVQSVKNFMMRSLPVYQKEVSGISKKVSVLNGNFPKSERIAIHTFGSFQEAELWKDSSPEIRLPDWVNRVHMIIVPVSKLPPVTYRFIEMADLRFENVNQYLSEYSRDVGEQLREADVCCQVLSACSDSIYKVTNGWNPKHLVLKFWRSETEFKSAYNSEQNVKFRERWFVGAAITCSYFLKDIQGPVFILIRFLNSRVWSLMEKLSANKNYSSDVSGISHKVCILEGNFPKSKGVAILSFGSLLEAELWINNISEKRDWMDGVDIVITPVCKMPPVDKRFVEMIDLNFHNVSQSLAQYSSGVVERVIQDAEACSGVVSACANRIHKVKGLWDPFYLVINFWPSQTVFEAAYSSGQNRDVEREEFTIAFNLEPLKFAEGGHRQALEGEPTSKMRKEASASQNYACPHFESDDEEEELYLAPISIISSHPEEDEEDITIFPVNALDASEHDDHLGPEVDDEQHNTAQQLLAQSTHEVEALNENDSICAICALSLNMSRTLVRVTKCGHVFHYSCLYQWLRLNNMCPLCRDHLDQ